MKNYLKITSAIFVLSFCDAYAAEKLKQFPYISGELLTLVQSDHVLSTKKDDVPSGDSFIYAQADISVNIDKNWTAKTQWRLQPNDVLTTRNKVNPERYRTFLSEDRGVNVDEMGLLVEELKIEYENEDLRAFAGKFDPTFGTAWRKTKRIGVFTAQMAEDYNLREKLGVGVTALLENSNITLNSFVNDKTSLGRSVINDRGRADNSKSIAGNSNAFSSYSVSMDGENFLTVDNLFYNLGYRSLGVDREDSDSKREQGYVFGLEYLYKVSRNTSIIPFAEFVKIKNFNGEKSRDATYSTLALIGKYSSWTGSVSYINRDIRAKLRGDKLNDKLLQLTVGYKFTDNLTIDISRANVKEDGYKGSLLGANLMYVYKF